MRCPSDENELEIWPGLGVASVYNGGGCPAVLTVASFVWTISPPLPAYSVARLARLLSVDGRLPLDVGEKIEATNLKLCRVDVGVLVLLKETVKSTMVPKSRIEFKRAAVFSLDSRIRS